MPASDLGRAWTQLVREPSDLAELRDLLARAQGRVSEVAPGYAGELLIDVGSDSTGKEQWLIGTQASSWRVMRGNRVVAASDADALPSDPSGDLVGAELCELDVDDGLDLIARFRDGRTLLVQCKVKRAESGDPPCWEVFTPSGLVVAGGPGERWSAAPAEVPERELTARRVPFAELVLGKDLWVVAALLSATIATSLNVIGRPLWVAVPASVAAIAWLALLVGYSRDARGIHDQGPEDRARRGAS